MRQRKSAINDVMSNEISLSHTRLGRQYLNLQGFYILPSRTLCFALMITKQGRTLVLKETHT